MPPANEHTRRQYLRLGGAVAVGSASAGCLEMLPPLGQRINYGRVDVPPAGTPRYRRWLPATSALPRDAYPSIKYRDEYPGIMYSDVQNTGGEETGYSVDHTRGFTVPQLDYFGIDWEAFDHVTTLNLDTFAIELDADRDTIDRTLTDTVYESTGVYYNYDLYTRANGSTFAVSDSAVLFARKQDRDKATMIVKAMADAGAGRIDRLHEQDEAFAMVSDTVGSYPFLWFIDSEMSHGPQPRRSTTAIVPGASAVYFVMNHFYHEGQRPERAVIRKNVEEDRRALSSSAADIEIDGQRVRIKLRSDPPEYDLDDLDRYPPLITWTLDHDRQAGTVLLRHEAADTVPAENLRIRPTGKSIPQFQDEYTTVEPGDSITLSVDAITSLDNRVALSWKSSDIDNSAVMTSKTFDSADTAGG